MQLGIEATKSNVIDIGGLVYDAGEEDTLSAAFTSLHTHSCDRTVSSEVHSFVSLSTSSRRLFVFRRQHVISLR